MNEKIAWGTFLNGVLRCLGIAQRETLQLWRTVVS